MLYNVNNYKKNLHLLYHWIYPFIKGIKHIMDCENGGLTTSFIEMYYQLKLLKWCTYSIVY